MLGLSHLSVIRSHGLVRVAPTSFSGIIDASWHKSITQATKPRADVECVMETVDKWGRHGCDIFAPYGDVGAPCVNILQRIKNLSWVDVS